MTRTGDLPQGTAAIVLGNQRKVRNMNMVVENAAGVSDSDYGATRRQTVHGVYIFRTVGGGVLDVAQHDAYARRASRCLAAAAVFAVRSAVVRSRGNGGRSGHRHGSHGPGFGGSRLVVPKERQGCMGPVRLVHVKKKGKRK